MTGKVQTTALLLAALGMGYLGGQLAQDRPAAADAGVAELLRAKKIELIAPDGKSCLDLDALNGNPAMMLYDDAHKLKVMLSADKSGGSLVLNSRENKLGASLSSDSLVAPLLVSSAIEVNTVGQKAYISLATKNGEPTIGLADEDGKLRLQMVCYKKYGGGIGFSMKNGDTAYLIFPEADVIGKPKK